MVSRVSFWVLFVRSSADTETRDVHWLNTVKVTKSSLESSLGPAKVDQRARNFFVLGTSMSALFDINSVTDFLRSLLRLLDEWETFAEGGGKVVSVASAL